jgi:hypothetical protein
MAFGVGQTPVPVRWYFAAPGQPWAPDGNQFTSTKWDGPDDSGNDLGERFGPTQWANGKDVKNYPVQTSDGCMEDLLLQNGLSSGQTTSTWSVDGKLDCCTTPTFDCTLLPNTLHVAISDLSGCGGIVGTFDIFNVAPCVWQGGTPLFTLGYSMGAWFRFLNCTGGDPTWTQVSFTFGPLNLVFDVLDSTGAPAPALCCGPSGLDTFRVTVTE